MSDDLRERLDLLAETDPLALRDEAFRLLDRVEQPVQQQAEALAAAQRVRRLSKMTIAFSCRTGAIQQAEDTLTALDGQGAAEAVAADSGPLGSLLTDVILDDLRKARPDAPPDEDEQQAARELAAALTPVVMEVCDYAAVNGKERERAERAEAAVERARLLARYPRSSQGRVNNYVPAAALLTALDQPAPPRSEPCPRWRVHGPHTWTGGGPLKDCPGIPDDPEETA